MKQLLLVTALLTIHLPLDAQSDTPSKKPAPQIDWQLGPVVAKIGSQAQIKVPEGYRFAGEEGAKKFLELTQSIPSGQELGVFLQDKGNWFVIFEFEDVGYVKDDEKKSLDADGMLKSIRENSERANELRRQKGWETLTVVGWLHPPRYNDETHNLEWSLKGQDSKGELVANYNTRYLGRRGVMRVGVVSNPAELDQVLVGFKKVMGGFQYTADNDYRAFVKGDKIAEYGLSALVVGGAAAVATKTGLLKGLWKFVLVGWKFIVAGIAGLGALLKRMFTRQEQGGDPANPQS